MAGKVTIEDISRETGLSRGTVSRALNNKADISEATKQRVLAACARLNYTPSAAARSLATGRSYAVAVLVDDLESGFATAFLRGVLTRAEQQSYGVFVLDVGDRGDTRVRSLSPERVDALLLTAPLTEPNASALRAQFARARIGSCWPIAAMDSADVLSPDYEESGRLVGRLLTERAATEDALLYVHRAHAPGAERCRAGFEEICRSVGIAPERVVFDLPPGEDSASLDARLERVTAVGTSDDALALRVMFRAERLGRSIGDDLRLVGQGNDRIAREFEPGITSVDFSGAEIGERLFDLVTQRIAEERHDGPQSLRVAPRLIERRSTGARDERAPVAGI